MKQAKNKLRSRRGVSLTEMLTAVLVLSLVTLVVAAGVNSATSVYRRSVALSDAQTLSSTLSIALMDELRYARDVETNGTAVTFTSNTFGEGVSVGTDADGQPGHLTVGGQLLVGTGAYALNFRADPAVSYDDSGTFHVTLSIYDQEETAVRTVDFSVTNLQK